MIFCFIYLVSLLGLLFFGKELHIPVLYILAFIPIFNVIILVLFLIAGLIFFGGKK